MIRPDQQLCKQETAGATSLSTEKVGFFSLGCTATPPPPPAPSLTHPGSRQRSCRVRGRRSPPSGSSRRLRQKPTFAENKSRRGSTVQLLRTPERRRRHQNRGGAGPDLAHGLHAADVGVGAQQDVLQLGLLLVHPLHRQLGRLVLAGCVHLPSIASAVCCLLVDEQQDAAQLVAQFRPEQSNTLSPFNTSNTAVWLYWDREVK